MGNQARVEDKSTVVSTSTRNFPNRLGKGANVFLASAELAAITGVIGKIPTPEEYMEIYNENVKEKYDDIFTYLNFDKLSEYNS
jgi:aconitate hydratase 2/2-methylisocitrate dehydratase